MICLFLTLSAAIQVAFAQSEVTVLESISAQLCAVIASGQTDRSVSITFNVLLVISKKERADTTCIRVLIDCPRI